MGQPDMRLVRDPLEFDRDLAHARLDAMIAAIDRIGLDPSLKETLMRGFNRAADALVDSVH